MPVIYGIDVSVYQGKVDYKQVKADGKSFVIVRLGYLGYEGELKLDSTASQNIKAAQEAGMEVGIYVYSYCRTPEAARTAALNTIDAIRPYGALSYPVVFDIEDTSTSGTPYNTYGKALNTSIASAFLGEIENAGFYGMLYTYKSFAENYLNMEALSRYDLWVAQYASACTYAGEYGMWQYAGNSGRCKGVSGACDLNVAYKDYAAIIKANGLNGFSKSTAGAGTGAETLESLKLENEGLKARLVKLEKLLKEINSISKVS